MAHLTSYQPLSLRVIEGTNKPMLYWTAGFRNFGKPRVEASTQLLSPTRAFLLCHVSPYFFCLGGHPSPETGFYQPLSRMAHSWLWFCRIFKDCYPLFPLNKLFVVTDVGPHFAAVHLGYPSLWYGGWFMSYPCTRAIHILFTACLIYFRVSYYCELSACIALL